MEANGSSGPENYREQRGNSPGGGSSLAKLQAYIWAERRGRIVAKTTDSVEEVENSYSFQSAARSFVRSKTPEGIRFNTFTKNIVKDKPSPEVTSRETSWHEEWDEWTTFPQSQLYRRQTHGVTP